MEHEIMERALSVDWSRAQFALTALYHFLFVPLTLGLSFILAIMETIYVKTKNEQWKKITQFWLSIFAINFAIGVATGIIMEFEFGTNWANYSWFVGDIFGAPLAIEGMMAFFLEATFFAVMFFGWNKVSPKFHLLSTWLVAIGSNLSAFWILVANGWMQFPIGTTFNVESARNEMTSFLDVALSPVGISKFLHTIASGYIISALVVMGISAWFILKKRHLIEAKKSLIVGASFGLVMSVLIFVSGDESAYQVAQKQPMKLAAMEGIYDGEHRAGLIAFGILDTSKEVGDKEKDTFLFNITIPYALSFLGNRSFDSYIPGIHDLIYGNEKRGIMSVEEKMQKGKIALEAFGEYKQKREEGFAPNELESYTNIIQENMPYFGYGYLKDAKEAVPPIALTFYTFHLMVALGTWFFVLFIVVLYLGMANNIMQFKKILWLCVLSIPLGYIAAECGWIVAEVGRQPWAIQDLMPVGVAATNLGSVNIKISFFIFLALFTTLLIAEIGIMLRQIKKGFSH